MPEALSWQLCVNSGYDAVFLQETRGMEQKKDGWPRNQLFYSEKPPQNDRASGVATFLSKELARCVAPGGVIRGIKYPSRILLVPLTDKGQ